MRYAIYFAAAADDPLMQLGSSWLGRDPFAGVDRPQPAVEGLSPERVRELTSSPRRYGFHGTLKAPFFLADGQSEDGLLQTCHAFATEIAPFEIAGLSVNELGGFLALTPDQREPELNAFAALCVRRFEKCRAELDEADLERRRKAGLSPKLDGYLTQWGYPYIFDEFRFHMTLSVKLEQDGEAASLKVAAKDHFESVTGRPRSCDSFGLYVEPARGAPFEVHSIFGLTGAMSPVTALGNTTSVTRKETA